VATLCVILLAAFGVPVSLGGLLASPAAAAATATVLYVAQSGSDSNSCTSVGTPCATITHALALAPFGATINVAGTIHDDMIDVTSPVTITGVGAPAGEPAVIDGSHSHRVFVISANTTLDHLTITGGSSSTAGGGIFAVAEVTLQYVTVTANSALDGAGVNLGFGAKGKIEHSILSDNHATCSNCGSSGGGVSVNGGSLAISDSTVSGNSSGMGGGVFSRGPTTVTNSTITGNVADTDGGGGLDVKNLLLTNSTVTGNNASFAGGISTTNGTVTLIDSTVAGNTVAAPAEPDILNDFGTIVAGGSIVGGCSDAAPFTHTSLGYNIDPGASCGWDQPTDHNSTDPQLGVLADNGGPTQTMLPTAGSPAINVIPAGTLVGGYSLCGRTDQRGVSGPEAQMTKCSVGAVEASTATSLTQPTLSVSSTTAYLATTTPFTTTTPLTASGGGGAGLVTYTVENGTAAGCAVSQQQPYTLSATTLGTCTVTAHKAADPNYVVTASAPAIVTISKAPQAALTITSTSGEAGTALDLTTSGGTTGGAVTYSVTNGTASGCSVTGAVLATSNAGTCIVTATMAGDGLYDPVSSAPTTVTLSVPADDGSGSAPWPTFTETRITGYQRSINYGSENSEVFQITIAASSSNAGASLDGLAGTVKVYTLSTPAPLCMVVVHGPRLSCRFAATALPPRSYPYAVFAHYRGAAGVNFSDSESDVFVMVNPAASAVTGKLSSSSAKTGEKVTIATTVKVGGLKSIPTGAITITSGKTKIAKATLTAKNRGTVVVKLPRLKPGKYSLVITYAGTSVIGQSASRKISLVVTS
jgi:hypothetical protein